MFEVVFKLHGGHLPGNIGKSTKFHVILPESGTCGQRCLAKQGSFYCVAVRARPVFSVPVVALPVVWYEKIVIV